jgi:hypothetical protein
MPTGPPPSGERVAGTPPSLLDAATPGLSGLGASGRPVIVCGSMGSGRLD